MELKRYVCKQLLAHRDYRRPLCAPPQKKSNNNKEKNFKDGHTKKSKQSLNDQEMTPSHRFCCGAIQLITGYFINSSKAKEGKKSRASPCNSICLPLSDFFIFAVFVKGS